MSDMHDYDPLEPFSEDEFVSYTKRELRNLDAGREEWDDGDDRDNNYVRGNCSL